MTITREELGKRIRSARESLELTQEEVAEYLDVSRSRITKMEQGKSSVSSVELEKLAHYFGRSISDFFSEKFEPEKPVDVLFRLNPDLAKDQEIRESLLSGMKIGREITNLEQLLQVERNRQQSFDRSLNRPSSKWNAIRQGTRLAKQERSRLDLGTNPIHNIAEHLETQGIRTAAIFLPQDISGLTVSSKETGIFVVVNSEDIPQRIRFSYTHEYCHALLDVRGNVTVSRRSERDELQEVRANAFAAEFLMPEDGVLEYIESLGKELEPRRRVEISDEEGSVSAENRPEPGSRDVQLYDIVQLAHYFDVSYKTAMYRLKNIKEVNLSEDQFEQYKDRIDTFGQNLADFLGLEQPDQKQPPKKEFKHRFLSLALEAYRREQISFGKLVELAGLVDVSRDKMKAAVEQLGIDDSVEGGVFTGDT